MQAIMRLVDRQVFVTLPVGTIYSDLGGRCDVANVRIKGETRFNDDGEASNYYETVATSGGDGFRFHLPELVSWS